MTMNKRLAILIVALGVLSGALFAGFSVWHSASTTPTFETGGYVLCGVGDEAKWASFQQGEKYVSTLSGTVNFTSTESGKTSVPKESFVHFDDGSMMALSDGVLLDFNDLSDNFINNYYLNAGVRIAGNGSTYTAETSSGTMEFGEYLWKLSDQKFMVVSPSLKVHLSDSDIREVSDYVQIVITEDKVVYLLTSENLWMTISDTCYVETAGGVRIYPVSQLIENDAYKLSMAKLSISMDDAIVLTQDETRRQIVPELNINAVDGEDGQDGEDGRTGQNGQAGEAGIDGENGQKGEDGQTGADGKQGANGAAGARGSNGSGGANGGNGAKGNDADAGSTTNSALPTMTITDWDISATRLRGTIKVTDNGSLLAAIVNKGEDYLNAYPGSVTITNVKTGEPIPCYPLVGNDVGDNWRFDFYKGTEEIAFSTGDSALEPDTEYTLSVTAYYAANDQSGLVYSREFIARTFYTDSTGVTLACETATENSVTVSATISDSYLANFSRAIVFLLTPEQNSGFTVASISDATSYTDSYTISSFNEGQAEISFNGSGKGLPANTKYIARVYVETTGGLKTLTNQELEVVTLKRIPSFVQDGSVPSAYYNRTTGAFEVYRPAMQDPDGGAESYTYTAYYQDGSDWVEVSKRTITPSTGEPVEFHLDSGKVYRFGVTMSFNDNEKLVDLDLGYSNIVEAAGDTLPKLTLTPEKNGTDFSKYKGTLSIGLGASSNLKVDPGHPLELQLYADQTLNIEVSLTDGNPVTDPKDSRYQITYNSASESTNKRDISLELTSLYKNTNYSITVTGYLDVGDGNGPVKRVIGTVSFRTLDTLTLKATWTTPANVSTAFARVLKLAVQDDQADTVRGAYAREELKKGQVTVELFRGTGTGKLRIAQKNFTQGEELDAIFGGGLEISAVSFGNPQLSQDGSYTLTITEVTDHTCDQEFGYVNDFENVLNSSEVVAALPTPPDLLTDPSKGVVATPILNKDAEYYGGKVNDDLPDDAIVGYTLAATYDNVQRIGKSITYYAYEYNTFFNALGTGNPLKIATPLMKITLPIDASKDTVSKVALLFGGTKTEGDATNFNGYLRYYTGPAVQVNDTLQSGMDRGYRYIFAYTAEYAGSTTGDSQTTGLYPDDHTDYTSFNQLYGGITEGGVQIGKGTYYILNSGMCEAPVVMPDFHTYVYESAPEGLASANASVSTGTVTLHYTWRDPEKLIVVGMSDDKNTKVSYPVNNGTQSQNITQTAVGSNNTQWYEVDLPYTITAKDGTALLKPTVNISEYRIDYSNVLESFHLEADVTDYPLATIPVDWSWESQFKQWEQKLPLVEVDTKNLSDNYILFRVTANSGNDTEFTSAINRAVGIKLTITRDDGKTLTFQLPLTYEGGLVYAKLASGQLGSDCLDRTFTLSTAELLYDTGRQGWNVAVTQPSFALQNINSESAKDKFAFGSYLGASDNSDIPGNNALLEKYSNAAFELNALRNVVGATEKDDAKLTFSFSSKMRGYNDSRFLFPDHMGVDADINALVTQHRGVYIVPKEIGAAKLPLSATATTWKMDQVTPTMSDPTFHTSLSAIKWDGFTVTGLPETSRGIKVTVYTDKDQANRLTTQYVKTMDLTVGSNGQVGEFEISGLNQQQTYYLAFSYINANGVNTLLLKMDASRAVYTVTTSGGVVIKITDVQYYNDNYFDKRLDMKFTINRTMNVEMRYDIYRSKADAENGTNPLLKQEDMVGGANEILTIPDSLSSTQEHTLKLNLTPSTNRNKLKPGTTYYMKLTAQEKDQAGTGYTVSGTCIQDFTIDPIGDYGALIYVKNAASDSITYQVTINDPQFTLMGRKYKASPKDYEGALYAVRFTDEAGNLLHTVYDGEVYSAVDPKVFVLDKAALSPGWVQSIEPGKMYQLHIYAVPDDDHNSEIDIDGTPKTWSDFFAGVGTAMEKCGQQLMDILDRFWQGNGQPDTTQNETQGKLLIATKKQSTTTDEGWLLNTSGMYASRYDPNTVRVIFQESIGLIKTNGDPVFSRIDWSVQGMKYDGNESTPVFASGSSLRSQHDALLVPAQIGGYDTYYFKVPYDLGQGSYTITLQFYLREDDAAPTKAITLRGE